ncbi:MAG: T9SS type A sorting domain-containing protein [Flavobacteriaceae bacterium]
MKYLLLIRTINLFSYKKSFHNFKLVIAYLLFAITQIFGQTPAFPGAEGFGKYTSGGRGGDVYKVTNLNDSGPGSFREACNATGARTIVFDVSGNINLNSDIIVTNGDLTIAGQTAPGDGICIAKSSFVVQASNVMVRYLRFRLGDNGYKDANGNVVGSDSEDKDVVRILGKPGGTNNVIFDHCSMSWSIDEIVEIYGSTNAADGVSDVTFQYCIFSEALYSSHHTSGNNSEGFKMSENTDNVTVYKNLFSSNWEHSIRSEGGCSFEMINNIVYNFRYTTAIGTANHFALINSFFKKGEPFIFAEYMADYYTAPGYPAAQTKAYASGNVSDYSGLTELDGAFLPFEQTIPPVDSGINPDTLNDAIAEILENSGAILPIRDAVDNRIINGYNTTTSTIIDTQAEVGGFPTLNSTSPLQDTDNDGMPDSWEITNGLNINDSADRNFLNAEGYTNLELYLNGFTQSFSAGSDITICDGNSAILTASGGSNFSWNTGETTASITVTPTVTTTYTVSGLDQMGNPATDDVTVFVNLNPTAEAGSNVAICVGNSTTLTASGGDTYAWSNGETTQSITVSPTATTTYTVTVTQNGCSDSDSVLVIVNQLPNANAGADVTINQGDSTTLTATGGGTYLWSTGETTANITVSPTATTSYSVIVTSAVGCQASDEVVVTVNSTNTVTANAGEDQTICEGDSATLTASGGTNYLWSTGETTATIVVTPSNTTTYTVTVTDGADSDTDNVTVFVNPIPNADAGADQDICEGESATLTASGGNSYLWNTGETSASISVNPTATTTYSVTVYQNGCEATDDVQVTVNPLPTANAGADQTICVGESATLTASGGDTYLWSTGETTQSITLSPNTTTIYSVTAYQNGCEATDDVMVTVNPLPNANAGADVTINQGDSTTLTATGGGTYLWNTGETTASITVSPTATTTYSVIVTSAVGCQASDEVIVTVNSTNTVTANAGEDQTICEGDSATLTASGGTDYLWSTGETTATIVVTPNATATYSVIVSEGNSSDTDEVTVFVNPLPNVTVSGDETILQGNYVTLSASGANTYEWSNGATAPNIAVNPSVTTVYSVKGYINNCYEEKEITVSVVEQVVASVSEDTTICAGETITLTASGGENYLWNTGETTQSIDVSPTENTTYQVTVSNSLDEDIAEVTVSVESCEEEEQIEEPQTYDMQIYTDARNQSILNVKIQGLLNPSELYIHNVDGRLVHSQSFGSNNGQQFVIKLNTSIYNQGVYFITLKELSVMRTKRIVFH